MKSKTMGKGNKKTFKDLRKTDKSRAFNKEKDEHPSYGQISFARMQCGGEGFTLFGSKVKHHTGIALKIKKCTRSRNAYGEHYFGHSQIVEVILSPAQFTGLISSFNTEGVPCTLSWLQGEGSIETPPDHDIIEEMHVDITKEHAKIKKIADDLEKSLGELLRGAVKKEEKETIRGAVIQINNYLNSNLSFLEKQQKKRLEKATAEAVAEAESAITGIIKSAGMEAIADKIQNKLVLTDERDRTRTN
jgi:hypothetical protein